MTRLNIVPAPYGFHRFAMATVVTKDANGKVILVENADRVWIRANGAFRFGIPGQSLGLWPADSRVVAVISAKGELLPSHPLMALLGGTDLSTAAGRAALCMRTPSIVKYMEAGQTIQAIKEYRDSLYVLLGEEVARTHPAFGLLMARNAVYDAMGKPHN